MWDLSSAFVKSSIKVPHELPQHVASQSTTDSADSSDVQAPPEPVAHIPRQEPPSPIIKQTLDFGHTALSSPPSYGVVEDTWSTTVSTEVRRGEGRGGESREEGRVRDGMGERRGGDGREEGMGWDWRGEGE